MNDFKFELVVLRFWLTELARWGYNQVINAKNKLQNKTIKKFPTLTKIAKKL